MSEAEKAELAVLRAIAEKIMPQLYIVIDDLLDNAPDAPKELVLRAKRLLPAYCPHSFEHGGKPDKKI